MLCLRYSYLLLLLICHFGLSQDLKIIAVDEPPAVYINQENQHDGYILAIIHAMQKLLNNKTDLVFVPEARALNIMDHQPNTILLGISRTATRENKFHWLGQVLFKKWQVYALSDYAYLDIKTLEDLRTMPSIGVVRGDVREEWLVNLKFKNLTSVTLHKQNIQMLNLGRVSAIVYDIQGLAYHAADLGLSLDHFKPIYTLNIAPVYIVLSLGSTPAVLKNWQNAFDTLIKNGGLGVIADHWHDRLINQYNIASDIENNILVF